MPSPPTITVELEREEARYLIGVVRDELDCGGISETSEEAALLRRLRQALNSPQPSREERLEEALRLAYPYMKDVLRAHTPDDACREIVENDVAKGARMSDLDWFERLLDAHPFWASFCVSVLVLSPLAAIPALVLLVGWIF